MGFNPHKVPPPKSFKERIEDLIEASGSLARAVILDAKTGRISLRGDYADILLAKRALVKAGIVVE